MRQVEYNQHLSCNNLLAYLIVHITSLRLILRNNVTKQQLTIKYNEHLKRDQLNESPVFNNKIGFFLHIVIETNLIHETYNILDGIRQLP